MAGHDALAELAGERIVGGEALESVTTLEDQDRSGWDAGRIEEGLAWLDRATSHREMSRAAASYLLADVHRRLGDLAAAGRHYETALARARTDPERAVIRRRLDELDTRRPAPLTAQHNPAAFLATLRYAAVLDAAQAPLAPIR